MHMTTVITPLFWALIAPVHAQPPALQESGHDHASHQMKSAYAGDESREIKALSETEVTALLNGEGMGMAMAAELNHYPGPRHVLDLADQLHLSEAQEEAVRESYDHMHAEAIRLGKLLVGKERILDEAFASKKVSVQSLRQMTEEIAGLRGRLRDVHLAAHLSVKAALTEEQIQSYDKIRGYAGNR